MGINNFVSEYEINAASAASNDLLNELKKPAGGLGYTIYSSIVCDERCKPRIVIEACYTLMPEISIELEPINNQKLLTELIPKSCEYSGKTFPIELRVLSDIPSTDYL
ncbi:MAG: hypothetical protein ACP5OA_05010 [Candidatus Woesearchaeota archaeon]